jgi:hypothetical protein
MMLFTVAISLLSAIAMDFFLQISFTYPTYVFVVISAATIFCVHCSGFIRYLISKRTPLRDWGDHKYQEHALDLALYVLCKKNLAFLIYVIYFIFVAVTSFQQVQYGTYLMSSEMDLAVTNAFLLFLASTNIFGTSQEVDLDSEELLSKILRLALPHDEQADE